MPECTHLDMVRKVTPTNVEVCEDCLRIGSQWVHLRLCLTCGYVGCCDDSPNRHANKHFHNAGHPIIQSLEPNEAWAWCYIDKVYIEP